MNTAAKICAAAPSSTNDQTTPCSQMVAPPFQPAPPPPNSCFKQPGQVQCYSVDNANPIVANVMEPGQLVADCNHPVEITWPQDPAPPTPKADPAKPNPLNMIPDNIVPQTITVLNPGNLEFIKQTRPHPLCPDAQMTLAIDPPKKKPLEIRIPEFKVGVRPPQRPWIQCVESQLINDQVRRPLARVCHKRELPPLVLPVHEFERIRMRTTERERQKAEIEQRKMDYECQKLKSRYRHSLWNNTTESIIARKEKNEADKKRNELESNQALIAHVAAEKDRASAEQLARAKKLMLFRKGLIRDFHAAMANSKMLKDIEDEKERNKGRQDEKNNKPYWNETCMKKMMEINNRPEYTKTEKKKRVHPKLLETLKADEKRVKERQCEVERELCDVQRLMMEFPSPLPQSYLKYIAEPKCEPGDKEKRQCALREELFSEIHDKLATDAFIEAHEDEIDRQACEFNKYKRTVDRLRKEKERQLIVDKVNYNIAKSEKAAKALVLMRKKEQARSGEYDALKEQWESEWDEKVNERNAKKDKKMAIIYKDFWERRNAELCKQQLLDPSRQWARERLVAVENFEQECERKSDKKRKAEEIALFQQAQIADRKCRELREKHLDDIWGCKMKQEYEVEMSDMKKYANECIQDWASKGRTIKPLQQAMKKWDYDAGMYPFSPPMNLNDAKCVAKSTKEVNRPSYETTSKRLGFSDCGGT